MEIRRRVKFLDIGEHLVPQVPAAAEGFFHQLCLFRRGIRRDLEGRMTDFAVLSLPRHDPASHQPCFGGKVRDFF